MASPAERVHHGRMDASYFCGKKVVEVLKSGQWSGQRAFILGGGPSIKGLDFTPLQGEKTIGINRTLEFFPTSVSYMMDCSLFNSIQDETMDKFAGYGVLNKWKQFKGIKVLAAQVLKRQFEGVYLVRRRPQWNKIVSFSLEDGIYAGTNSGMGAMMLAIALGANPVYMMGFDFNSDGPTHFHAGYPWTPKDTNMSHRMTVFLKDFNEMAPAISQAGIRVVNLNPNSALKCFEFSTIEQVLKGGE